jgi:hypothetical protein
MKAKLRIAAFYTAQALIPTSFHHPHKKPLAGLFGETVPDMLRRKHAILDG